MRALIMAGGVGTRLGLGEKPLVDVGGHPMISLVLSAFENAGYNIPVVVSPRTPYKFNWARVQGFECIRASGHGYIRDLHETVKIIEETGPFFTCVADLPCLNTGHITKIRKKYEVSGKEALSTWVPLPYKGEWSAVSFVESINGVDACPVGINIIRGDLIERQQEEEKFMIMDRHLAYNINTREDLEKVRHFFSLKKE